MLTTDQSWLALLINIAIAFLVAIAIWRATRASPRKTSPSATILGCAVCVTIIGAGFVLQPLLLEAFIAPPSGAGSLYLTEYQTFRAIRNLAVAWLSGGIIPGVAVGLILQRTKFGETLVGSCLTTILVLVGYDLFQLLLAMKNALADPEFGRGILIQQSLTGLPYSLVCDGIGGFIGGSICRSSTIWVTSLLESENSDDRYIMLRRLLISGVGSVAVVLGAYIIFLHPINEDVTLNVMKYESRTITIAPLSSPVIGAFTQRGDILAKSATNAVIGIPLSRLHIVALGMQDLMPKEIAKSALQFRLNLELKVNGRGAPITSHLIGAVNCDTAEEAYTAARTLGVPGQSFNLADTMISLKGLIQELNAYTDSNIPTNASYWVPRGQALITTIQAGPSPNVHTIASPAGTLDIPIGPGTAVVLSALPDITSGLLKGLDLIHQPQSVPSAKLLLASKGSSSDLSLPLSASTATESACHAIPLPETQRHTDPTTATPSSYKDVRFVILIQDAAPSAVMSLNTGFSALLFKSANEEPRLALGPASYLQIKAANGDIRIGDRRLTLRSEDTLEIASSSLTFDDLGEDQFRATGISRYVLLNGHLMTPSLWTSLEPTLRNSLILGFLGLLGWIVKRHWESILRSAKRLW